MSDGEDDYDSGSDGYDINDPRAREHEAYKIAQENGMETTWTPTEMTIIPVKKTMVIQWSCAFRTLAKHEVGLLSKDMNPWSLHRKGRLY